MLTTADIENAHKHCPKKPGLTGTELRAAQKRSWDFYGRCLRTGRKTLSWYNPIQGGPMDFHHIVPKVTGKQKRRSGRECLGNLVPLTRVAHTNNPIRPRDVQELSELPQFKKLVERINGRMQPCA